MYVFSLKETSIPHSQTQSIAALKNVLRKHPVPDQPEAIQDYFKKLRLIKGDKALDQKEILKMSDSQALPFAEIAEKFSLIDSPTMQVYLPVGEGTVLCEQLRAGFHSRSLFRRLGMYSVQVYPEHFQKLWDAGGVQKLDSGDGILTDLSLYDECMGLTMDVEVGQCWFA